jgi:hypothetical protein
MNKEMQNKPRLLSVIPTKLPMMMMRMMMMMQTARGTNTPIGMYVVIESAMAGHKSPNTSKI